MTAASTLGTFLTTLTLYAVTIGMSPFRLRHHVVAFTYPSRCPPVEIITLDEDHEPLLGP